MIQLPPLPEPALTHDRHGHMLQFGPCYTADQLRADRLAVIEACARVCDARFTGDLNREDQEARRCAAALRALKEQVK